MDECIGALIPFVVLVCAEAWITTIDNQSSHTWRKISHTRFTWFGKLAYAHGKYHFPPFSPTSFRKLRYPQERALTLILSNSLWLQVALIYNFYFLGLYKKIVPILNPKEKPPYNYQSIQDLGLSLSLTQWTNPVNQEHKT